MVASKRIASCTDSQNKQISSLSLIQALICLFLLILNLSDLYTLSEEVAVAKMFCNHFWKGSTLTGNNLLALRPNFLPFRVNFLFRQGYMYNKASGVTHKLSCFLKDGVKTYQSFNETKYNRLSLFQSPRGSLKYFKISVPQHIRFAELRKTIK